jgi:exodeoxyribonuclease III
VLCMQETKLADDAFPALTFEALGYRVAHHGQGQWNGVAILSKVGLDDVVANFAPGDRARSRGADHHRHLRRRAHQCCYVPNGRSLDDDHYRYKLSWLGRLRAHLIADTESPAPT